MEKAWEILNKLLDNFNLGRAVIYMVTGLAFLLPLLMILLMLVHPAESGLVEELKRDFSLLFDYRVNLLVFSYIFGFSVVHAIYPMIKKEQEELKAQLMPCRDDQSQTQSREKQEKDEFNINRNFLHLTNSDKREPLGWLISEYFRFVEAAVYPPIGLVFFLLLMAIYFLVGIAKYGLDSLLLAAVTYFCFLVSVTIFIYYWRPFVIRPTISSFLRAKRNLICGIGGQKNTTNSKGRIKMENMAESTKNPEKYTVKTPEAKYHANKNNANVSKGKFDQSGKSRWCSIASCCCCLLVLTLLFGACSKVLFNWYQEKKKFYLAEKLIENLKLIEDLRKTETEYSLAIDVDGIHFKIAPFSEKAANVTKKRR